MALKNTRAGNYPEWYQNVVSEADMAENSSSPGCMVIKPWGYGIWERIRDVFDEKIKSTDHENCYFPMFIPLSFFQKEAEHVDGFAKEMAVVTHSRLSMPWKKEKPHLDRYGKGLQDDRLRHDRNTGCRVTWCFKSHSVQASQGIPETGRVHE